MEKYSKEGYRVLSLCYKDLGRVEKLSELKNVERNTLEEKSIFLGLMVFENPMKEGSDEVIEILNQVNIASVMVTGDNYLTALKVS